MIRKRCWCLFTLFSRACVAKATIEPVENRSQNGLNALGALCEIVRFRWMGEILQFWREILTLFWQKMLPLTFLGAVKVDCAVETLQHTQNENRSFTGPFSLKIQLSPSSIHNFFKEL